MWCRRSTLKVYLSETAIRSIRSECSRVDGVETGGILIGYHSEDWMVISHATGPGPDAVHGPYDIELDLAFITKELKNQEKSLPVGYEGNWHCHPGQRFIKPSRVDEHLQNSIVRSPNYDVDTVLLLIVPSTPIQMKDFNCFIFSSRWRSYRVAEPLRSFDPF
jgi:integrative and conjugative element protein (TIGR02256 family)